VGVNVGVSVGLGVGVKVEVGPGSSVGRDAALGAHEIKTMVRSETVKRILNFIL